jgi:hypothetical protein
MLKKRTATTLDGNEELQRGGITKTLKAVNLTVGFYRDLRGAVAGTKKME